MNDMEQVIVPKSDQINADDLIAGPMVIKITSVSVDGAKEQPVDVYFEGSKKSYRPCKSMARVMVAAWGSDSKKYVGRSMKLYRDPNVKWGGMAVGGIRISHMSDIDKKLTMMLSQSRKNRAPFVVDVLEADAPAPTTTRNEEAENAALDAAMNGKQAFGAWWNSDYGKQHRDDVRGVLDECKRLAAESDAMPKTDDEEPPL